LGPTVFHGAQVTEVRAIAGESLKYFYYRRNAEGDVFLHGTREALVEVTYQPPKVILDMPLAVGNTWSQSLERRHFQNGNESHTVTVTTIFNVTSHETAKTQVGEYDCFAIQESLSGVALTNCYAADIGKIKMSVNDDDFWDLIDFDAGVPVDTTSWGAVKALYGSD